MSADVRGLVVAAVFALGPAMAMGGEVDFRKEIAPLLQQRCVKCHGPTKQQGSLRFDTRSGAVRAGDSGLSAIAPGRSAESELLRRVRSQDDTERMPPEGDPLAAAEIDLLERWIDQGASWPESEVGPSAAAGGELVVTDEDRQHWSFRPLRSPPVPEVRAAGAARSEIDRFILARLEAHGLTLSATASPRTLVRRIHFDLVGLPPTPQDVAEFEAAAARDPEAATAALVDRLLASPHFGERWGRHWLDVARYADSNGQEGDQDRPHAYQYRDFVIRALNDDLPYDEFVRRQIAGDELEPDNPLAVAATGFLVAGPHTVLNVPMEEEKIRNRYNELDDMLSTLGSGLLGLTLGCARCHDHKYDAIPTRDYYRLLAALHSGDRQEVFLGTRAEVAAFRQARAQWDGELRQAESRLADWVAEQRRTVEPPLRAERIAALPISDAEKALLRETPDADDARNLAKAHQQALAVSDDDLRARMSEDQRRRWGELRAAVARVKEQEPAPLPQALVFRETGAEPKPTWLFHRADFYDKSEPVRLGFLTVLTSSRSADDYWDEARAHRRIDESTYQRAALARWITDVDHGAGALLARVIVNRVWQHHFGEGLVRTPSDFGVQGERPSHPDLLEWLAHDFVAHGWRLKRLHRQILLSAVYLQGGGQGRAEGGEPDATSPAPRSADPENRLLWKRRPRRLEAEVLRDAMLAAAGTINLEPFGPAFKPPIAAEAMTARNLKTPYNPEPADSPNLRRRSVYMFHKRVVPYPLLQVFDRPDSLQSCGRRDATTVAPQALALLNDPFVRERAVEFADRLTREAGTDAEAIVRRAFLIALSRPPGDTERQAAWEFLAARRIARQQRDGIGEAEAARTALADFCQVLFGLNEFLYVD